MDRLPLSRVLRVSGLLISMALVSTACRVLPDLDEEQARAEPLAQTSKVFDANGRLITPLHAEEDRVLIPLARIPPSVQKAVVAIEDQRFWTHRGIDIKAMLRAAYVNATTGHIEEGGSTITQQYIKNRLLTPEQTIERKVNEAALAWQYEEEHSKEEILEHYLNTVYFGRGAYGVQRASKKFFSHPARRLRLTQAAVLAGLIAGPERWDPIRYPKRALSRRNLVLQRMSEQDLISEDRALRAMERPLRVEPDLGEGRYPAPHFVDFVKHQILSRKRFGETYAERYDLLFKGGLRIHTTIDLRMQRAAERAVEGVLSQPGDPSGALTAIDPRTGHIKAMVGGRDYFASRKEDRYAKVNLATGGVTGRQAGSAFKTFALVAALENGIPPQQTYPAPSTMQLADPVCRNGPGDPWNVQNYEGAGYGGNLTVEQATIASVNVVYAQIIRDVRPKRVVDVAHRMGIRSPLRPFCSAVLGANEVNTMEMASAYGTLAANGRHARPIAIKRVTDSEGEILFRSRPNLERAVHRAVAWTGTQILRKVVLSGTGTGANIGRPQAGKTGTAQQWRDAWFAGFVPQLSAAVWVGFPQGQISMTYPRTRIRVTGGSFPAQVWRAFMLEATRGLPPKNFKAPRANYIRVPIDITRGCVAGPGTPSQNVREIQFVVGTEPTQRCEDQPAVTVPSVIGMSAGNAFNTLQAAGYGVAQTVQAAPGYPPGTVISQSPAGGSSAPAGSTVTIVVSG